MSYTLYHGDCLEVMPTLAGKVDAIIADIPYGTTSCKWDTVIPLDAMWREVKRVIKPNGAVVLFGAQPFTSVLVTSNLQWFKYEWVWRKSKVTGYLNAKKQPLRQTENISIFSGGTNLFNPQMTPTKERFVSRSGGYSTHGKGYGTHAAISSSNGGLRYPYNVIDLPSENDGLHPTQKPVDLMRYLVRTYTNAGETVLDFTMGSGSTGEACLVEGRNFIGIEKEQKYYEIAQARLANVQPTLIEANYA